MGSQEIVAAVAAGGLLAVRAALVAAVALRTGGRPVFRPSRDAAHSPAIYDQSFIVADDPSCDLPLIDSEGIDVCCDQRAMRSALVEIEDPLARSRTALVRLPRSVDGAPFGGWGVKI